LVSKPITLCSRYSLRYAQATKYAQTQKDPAEFVRCTMTALSFILSMNNPPFLLDPALEVFRASHTFDNHPYGVGLRGQKDHGGLHQDLHDLPTETQVRRDPVHARGYIEPFLIISYAARLSPRDSFPFSCPPLHPRPTTDRFLPHVCDVGNRARRLPRRRPAASPPRLPRVPARPRGSASSTRARVDQRTQQYRRARTFPRPL